MLPSISLSALLWGAVFVTSCSAATSQTVSCTSTDASIVQFQKDVANSTAFCSYWSGSWYSPTDNPLGNLNATVISQVCQCFSAHPTLVTTTSVRSTTTSAVATAPTTPCSPKDANITTVAHAFLQPLVFCKYYVNGSQTRSKSPVLGVSPAKLSSVCSCATATTALFSSSSTKPASIQQATTTKSAASTTHSSSKATVTSNTAKPVSNTKPASSKTLSSSKTASTKPASTIKSASAKLSSTTKTTSVLAPTKSKSTSTKSTSKSTSTKLSSTAKTISTTKTTTAPAKSASTKSTAALSHATTKAASSTKAISTSSQKIGSSSTKLGSTSRKASSSTSTQHTSSHKITSSTHSAKASLITGSLPATATSQTASVANVPASTKIAAKPAVPSTINKAALANLTPSKNNTLAFKDAAASSFAANSNATFKYAAVMLDYSSLISAVTCSAKDSALSIKFTSESVATQAYQMWTKQSSLLFVTSASTCSANSSDTYFLASSMAESTNGIVTVKGSTKSLPQVMSSYAVKFSTGSSTSTTSAAKTNTKFSASGAIAQLQHAINSLSSSKLVTSPWGSQSQLFQYVPSAMSIFSNLNFYETLSIYAISEALLDGSIVSPQVSMYCIDCSVGGALGYSGSYSTVSGQAALAMTLAGSLDFNFKVGINAFAPLTTSVNIPVGQFALPQVQAGSFLAVQPIVRVSLVGNLSIIAPGQVVIGSQSSWSDVSITLNTNGSLSRITGAPVVNYPFSIEGPAEGGFSLTTQAEIVLQYAGVSGGATTRVSFLDSRTVSGQSNEDDSNCDGIMWSSSYSALDTALVGSSSITLQSSSGVVNQICVDQDTDMGTTMVTNTATATMTDDSWTTATDDWNTDDQTTATATNTDTATLTATWTDAQITAGTQTQGDYTFAFTGAGTFTGGSPQQTDSWSGGDDDGGEDGGDDDGGDDDGGNDSGSNWPWSWGDSGESHHHGHHGHSGSSKTTLTSASSTTPVVSQTTTRPTTISTTARAASTSSITSSTTPSTPANAASTRTPAAAGCIPNLYTFLSSDNQLWQLNSTLGYSGDLGYVEAGSIADCINQCESYGSGCSAVTWYEYGMNLPYCYLSSSNDLSNVGYFSGYVAYSAVRISGQSCISAQAPSCPGDAGGYYRASTGYAYGLQCATQYTGSVLAYVDSATDLQDCLEACGTVTDCASVSFAYGGSLAAPSCAIYNSTTSAAVSANLGYSVDSGFVIKY